MCKIITRYFIYPLVLRKEMNVKSILVNGANNPVACPRYQIKVKVNNEKLKNNEGIMN